MPNPSHTRRVKGIFRHTLDQLLLVDLIRYGIVALRYVWYAKLLKRLRTLTVPSASAPGAVANNTVMHNLKGLKDLAVNRSHLLIRPLSVIESLSTRACVLSVGPRSEGELFNLAAHGFMWSEVSGLDLISYSPKVQLGDMHDPPYAPNSFDAIVLGWVLAYSENPRAAALAMIRLVRPGGVIAVGVEYSPLSQDQVVADLGYLPGAKQRIESCKAILDLFSPSVGHVYTNHTVAPRNLGETGALCVIFSVVK